MDKESVKAVLGSTIFLILILAIILFLIFRLSTPKLTEGNIAKKYIEHENTTYIPIDVGGAVHLFPQLHLKNYVLVIEGNDGSKILRE